MELLTEIKRVIEETIKGSEVQVLDPRNDGAHLQAIVICEDFEGLSLLERHRWVMNCVASYFSTSLHALEIKAYTPNEVKKING